MVNISTAVRGHYDNDRYMWAIIIRRFCDSFTPTQSDSVLVTDTPVFRSLGAILSELTRQPIPPEFRVFASTIAAPVIGTTETILSSVALIEPPPIITTTLEATAIVSTTQGQASASTSTSQSADPITMTAEQTQTASLPVSV
jgi:hypothetical protein